VYMNAMKPVSYETTPTSMLTPSFLDNTAPIGGG
jgi:hypothetical protein